MKIEACFAVCFTGYKDRHDPLVAEFKRAGLPDPCVVWNFPSPYDKFVRERIPCLPVLNKKPGFFSAGIGQYRALKTAYELGCANALFAEDDCRFLKDVDKLHDILGKAPADGNLFMLDSFLTRGTGDVVEGWAQFEKARSSASYILDRKAMRRFIEMHESPVSGKYRRPLMRICDHWFERQYMAAGGVKMYRAKPNLAVQCECPSQGGNSGYENIKRFYAKNNIELSNYASFKGVQT